MLVRNQRNQFFEVLANAGIPSNFFREEMYAERYVISYIGTELYRFEVKELKYATEKFWIECRPGFSTHEYKYEGRIRDWTAVFKSFNYWANALRAELALPDLWAEAAKTAQLFASSATPSDDKFTRAELAEVQGQLRQLQQSLTTAALPEAARQKLIELTQTAAVKAEGLTKRDWQNWIIGGFISAITALSLNPTQAADVLKLVKAALGGLFLH